ncbi:uncharacterized protein [Chironomus tepperi]|uniref:uncharacterized protein isoform X1 n=1 Tax=Chironomus tepperi TaxID=113505 RepID=UPI00391F02A9
MDTCRLCNTSRNLNDLLKIENESLKIEKKLREMFNIELTSCSYTANNFCCRNCFKKLNNSHSFYLEIIENQKKFEAVSFEFNTVDVKVENFGDKNLNICEDIKVEKEENIEEDFGNSYDVGTFNDESNDLMEDNDDEHETFELLVADQNRNDNSLKIYSAGQLIKNDLNCLYDEYEATQVNTALCEMGFECLKHLFKEEKVDFDVFKSLNQTDMNEILRNYPVGIRKKIFQSYEIWQNKYLAEDDNTASRKIFQKDSASRDSQIVQQSSKDGFEALRIAYILNSTEAGISFKKHFNGQSSLLKKEKRKLVEIIVNYFITRKTKLTKSDFKRLADEIRQLFPQELSETYFCDDIKPSGMLYSKYHNSLRTFRKNDQMECMTKKRKFEQEMSNDDEKEEVTFSSEEIYSDEYVRTNPNGKFDKLNIHWKISSKCRKHKIIGMESNLSKILSEYMAYTRADGYMLLNSDFQHCQSTNNFKEKWQSMAPMLLDILLANISNQFVKSKLIQYKDLSETAKIVALLLGLHVFLYESGKWRPSILESFKFMVLIVKNESTQESEMNEWKKKLKDSNYNFLPTIIAYGENFENFKNKFLVCFNEHFYQFNNIFKALEVLLNMFVYFNLTLPPPNRNVFKFLMAKIYDNSEDLNASVKTLLNYFLQ